jgi:hypothetical protein
MAIITAVKSFNSSDSREKTAKKCFVILGLKTLSKMVELLTGNSKIKGLNPPAISKWTKW